MLLVKIAARSRRSIDTVGAVNPVRALWPSTRRL